MKTGRFFRYLWRLNAVLISLAAGGVCVVAATVVLSELSCGAQRRRAVEAAPTVVTDASDKLYLGPVHAVEGSDVLRGDLLARDDMLGIGSSGYRAETRNILYLDTQSTEARWLLPDSARIIAEETTVWSADESARSRRPIAQLALVKPKTADLELAVGALLIFDPSGRRLTTVAEGVRVLNHASLLDHDTILVLYERGRRYARALVDARTFEVKGVHDVAVPELR